MSDRSMENKLAPIEHKSARLVALSVLLKVFKAQGQSLDSVLRMAAEKNPQKALIAQWTYGVCRFYSQLQAQLKTFLKKELKAKDQDLELLLLLGLYELSQTHTAQHAVINHCVEVTQLINKTWASAFVNGVLRQAQRDLGDWKGRLFGDWALDFAHPDWLVNLIKQQYKKSTSDILAINNTQAPMSLRVNLQKTTRAAYSESLDKVGIAHVCLAGSETAIQLEAPCGVFDLPEFSKGFCSVQDRSAQDAAVLLDLFPGASVLDACAAPGGKTGHLLELEPQIKLEALDVSEKRLSRVAENLERLGFEARLLVGDAASLSDWWSGQPYDRILVDAPCTGTGVIRRHPDLKWLKKASDVAQTAETQLQILLQLWTTLKPGGQLVYTTCSILEAENQQVVAAFLDQTPDSKSVSIFDQATPSGHQRLAALNGHDGFFYAKFQKSALHSASSTA